MIKNKSFFTDKIRKIISEVDKDFNEILKGAGTALIIRVLGMLAGYIFTLLVTRNLGATAWGIYALATVLLQFSSVLGRLGLDMALLRFTAEYAAKGEFQTLKKIYGKAVKLIVPFSAFVAVVVYLNSPLLAEKILKKPYLTSYFKFVSFLIVPFVLLWFHRELIRGLKKIKEYMMLQQTGISVLSLLFFLFGFLFYKSYFLPLIALGIAIVILAFISIHLWQKYLKSYLVSQRKDTSSGDFGEKHTKNKVSYSYIFSVSIPMLFSGSLALIMGWTDTVMLGIFKTTQDVGIYNVALKLAMITTVALTAINTIAAPKFAEFWGRRDIDGLVKVARQSTKLIFWLTIPVFFAFFVFPSQILSIFGQDFVIASKALMILSVGLWFSLCSGSVGLILQMTGNQHFHKNVLFIGTVINIVLNYVLVPQIGITGAAIATAVSMIFWNLSFGFKVRQITGKWIFYPAFYGD